jgi:hypothetical protein
MTTRCVLTKNSREIGKYPNFCDALRAIQAREVYGWKQAQEAGYRITTDREESERYENEAGQIPSPEVSHDAK